MSNIFIQCIRRMVIDDYKHQFQFWILKFSSNVFSFSLLRPLYTPLAPPSGSGGDIATPFCFYYFFKRLYNFSSNTCKRLCHQIWQLADLRTSSDLTAGKMCLEYSIWGNVAFDNPTNHLLNLIAAMEISLIVHKIPDRTWSVLYIVFTRTTTNAFFIQIVVLAVHCVK